MGKRSRAGAGEWQALGQRLKALRLARHEISQRYLARRAGVSHSMVSMWERGQLRPSLLHLQKIAPVLGVSLNELTLLAGYRDEHGWLTENDDDNVVATLPADPLAAVTQALQAGPWPENISAAIYCLLAAAQDDKRGLWERRVSEAIREVEETGYIASKDELTGPTTPAEIIAFAMARLYRNLFQGKANLKLTRERQTESTQDSQTMLP